MIADLKPSAEYKDSGLPWLGRVPKLGRPDRPHRTINHGESVADRGERGADRGEQAPDWGEQALDRGEQASDRGELTERHLTPMVQAGILERRYPATPTHAEQAYRRSNRSLPLGPASEGVTS